jgi:hypothetical protein
VAVSNLWIIPEELGDLADSEYAFEACKTASYILWGLSGRRYAGVSILTETYPSTAPTLSVRQLMMNPNALLGYSLYTEGVSAGIRLRGYPVQSIISVTDSQGVELEIDQFALVEHSTLIFGARPAQNFTVTYSYGSQPPTAGRMAARELAQEFAKAWSGDPECRLPSRVTSITRPGITMAILDKQDFIDDLRTGVYAVDLFLKTTNPNKALLRSRVFSPDVRRARRGTTTDAGGYGTGGYGQ